MPDLMDIVESVTSCRCPADKPELRSTHCPMHGSCTCCHGAHCPTHDEPEQLVVRYPDSWRDA